LGGSVVSVTTDGFITSIEDLEQKFLAYNLKEENETLLSKFRGLRQELSGHADALEMRKSGVGLIVWSTRGQFGKNSGIKATTGFQVRSLSPEELETLLLETMKTPHKELEYIQYSLRSALDLYNKGGHVTMLQKDQTFRLHYDNRRLITNITSADAFLELLDSKPLDDVLQCAGLRSIGKLHKQKNYNRQSSLVFSNRYNSMLDLAIRNFVKGYLADPVKFNLPSDAFKTYTEIIEYIMKYDALALRVGKIKLTVNIISKLKNRNQMIKIVPKTEETLNFVNYLKIRFPQFDDESFFTSKP
jgi:hypothetical protein